MTQPIRFLHLADCHLGATFGQLPPAVSQAKRENLRQTFTRLIDTAIDREVNLVLIAGDLFDRAHPGPAERQLVRQSLQKLAQAGIAVYAIPGNHDPGGENSFWDEPLPGPGKIFSEPGFSSEMPEDLDIEIFGIGYDLKQSHNNLLQQFSLKPQASRSILLFHGGWLNFGGDYAKDHPFRIEDVEALPVNYLALGHYHCFTPVVDTAAQKALYPGDLEGLDFSKGESGPRVAVFGEITPEGVVAVEKVPVKALEMSSLALDVSALTPASLTRSIDQEAERNRLFQIVLSGLPSLELMALIPQLDKQYQEAFLFFRCQDETTGLPEIPTEGSQSHKILFVRELRQQMEKADPAQQARLRLALSIGLAAFDQHNN